MNVHNLNHQSHPYSPVNQTEKKRFSMPKIQVPMLAQVFGAFSLVLLITGLLTARQLSQVSQDLSSQAAGEQIILKLDPPTLAMQVNETKQFKVMANTQNLSMTATKLHIEYPADLLEMTFVLPTSADKFPFVLQPFKPNWFNATTNQHMAGVTLGVKYNSPVNMNGATVAAFSLKAKKAGTAKVKINDLNTEAAALTYNSDKSKAEGEMVVTITEVAPPPSGTVCWNFVAQNPTTQELYWPNACKGNPPDPDIACAAVITPLTPTEISQYNAWKAAGSVVPAVCGGTTDQTPKLNVSFAIQQLTKANITVENVEVAVRYKNSSTNQIEAKSYKHSFVSSTNGVFSKDEIALTGVDVTKISGPVEVFVKAPFTLRKKLGEGQVSVANKTITARYPQTLLFVGDFDRTTGQENWFRMLDIAVLLNEYRQISNPVTNQNKDLDIDRNGVINMLDISVLLNNYTQISREGDKL